MFCSQVVFLACVFRQRVKLQLRIAALQIAAQSLPIAQSHRLLSAITAKIPKQKLVLLLLAFAEQGR